VWHTHEASCHYRDFRELPAASARACRRAIRPVARCSSAGTPALAVAHVWAWYPNPDGVFAEANPWLAPYGGLTAREHHARNPAEMFYSQLTHRVAGVVLLTLAALTLWESWRRAVPGNAVIGAALGGLRVYLIPSSDPESWPYGPQRFGEIFSRPPRTAAQAARARADRDRRDHGAARRGGAAGRRWPACWVLALAGGATLFFHFHEGRLHVDAIYLQHVLMGSTAVGVGVAL